MKAKRNHNKLYSFWFIVPSLVIFCVFFLFPILSSLYYSMTVWDFNTATFCGLDNYKMFFGKFSEFFDCTYTDLRISDQRIKGCDRFFYCGVSVQRDSGKRLYTFCGFFPESCFHDGGWSYLFRFDASHKRPV